MDAEAKWLSQRISLLKTHLRELKQLVLREKSERHQLIQRHQQEHLAVTRKTPSVLAELVTEHTRRITALSIDFTRQRQALLARQWQEEVAQKERIGGERLNQSKRL